MIDMTSQDIEGIISGPRRTAQELPWWACGGLRFGCLGCGRCCRGASGGIFMRPCAERCIAAALCLTAEQLRSRFETSRWRFPSLKETGCGRCVMNGDDGRCRVYACRPVECRTWPFWPELLESPQAWQAAARRCPGMDSGPLWSPRRIAVVLAAHEDYVKKLSREWGKEVR